MYLVTTENIPGRNYQILGFVCGNMVQSKNAIKDLGANLKSIVGGELVSYTKMLSEAREIAIQRMIQQATSMGADAIVGIRFSSSSIVQGAAEILVAGTAVKLI